MFYFCRAISVPFPLVISVRSSELTELKHPPNPPPHTHNLTQVCHAWSMGLKCVKLGKMAGRLLTWWGSLAPALERVPWRLMMIQNCLPSDEHRRQGFKGLLGCWELFCGTVT